jgi:DNA repair protein RecO (recombination protein O)
MIQDTEAVVLRTLNHGDTSKIITLYSRKTGRLKLIAKGVRSSKSKATGLFQPTHHLRLAYYEKTQSELQLFKSGELVKGFYGLENDFDRLTLAQVVLELVDRGAEKEEPHPEVFNLLVATLERLNDPQQPTSLVYWYFHLQFLVEMGFRPETDRCHLCGTSLSDGGNLRARLPGITCNQCEVPEADEIPLNGNQIQVLSELLDHTWETVKEPGFSERERRQFWDFLWRYTRYHIEPTRNMRSLQVLKQLYG